MTYRRGLALAAVLVMGQAALAQAPGGVYIQVEARSTLSGAQDSARSFSQAFDNVNGFALGSGWYGIALGPFTEAAAQQELNRLRAFGQIPPDSYLEEAADYGRQFWPVGATGGATTAPVETQPLGEPGEDTAESAEAPADPAPVLETPREAREGERLLTRGEREQLQIALRWAGHYNGRIDAAFGRGTRSAMASWQGANGYDATGVLTTRQRADLLGQYNAVFDGLGMRRVTDSRAGISIEMPADVVSRDRYDPPFAVYDPSGDLQARVLLISQPGDSRTLAGLYEIMQTLEIVPLEGERSRDGDSFLLTGANDEIVSHTEVTLSGGELKGFTLVWPAGDEERRTRVLQRMQSSFERIGGVLDPAQVTNASASVDLVSGLQVRQPRASGSGFFVSENGVVLTSYDTVGDCTQITLDGSYDARLVAGNAALGAALLRPEGRLAPRAVGAFRDGLPRLQSEIAVAGYPYGGVLSAPTLTYGTFEDIRGLGGEEGLSRLALATEPGDAGGPVLDEAGGVVGMLLPADATSGQQLPQDVRFALQARMIAPLLDEAGVTTPLSTGTARMAPEDLTERAAAMTVLVSCWD